MGLSPDVVARVTGIETTFKQFGNSPLAILPQRVAVFAQGNDATTYSLTKAEYNNALDVALTYGFGSPAHLAALQLKPDNGDGIGTIPMTFYPLENPAGGTASSGDITPTVSVPTGKSGEFFVRVNNIDSPKFVLDEDSDVESAIASVIAAVNGTLEMPIIAADGTTKIDTTAKWKGVSSNDIHLEVIGPTDIGVTWAFTQHSGGLVNPTVDSALAQMGNVWETMILNCLDIADSTALTAYNNFGEGRWGKLAKKPLVVFTGTTESSVSTAITIPTTNRAQRVNSQLVLPASNDLPFVVAARQLARIITLANAIPSHDYGSQRATGLTPGADGTEWDFDDRQTAVTGGSSTVEIVDGVVRISDVVTFYHPTGDVNPAYRFVVDIVKLQNTIFNIDLVFASEEWDGAALLNDNDPTTEPTAKKPKMAKAEAARICTLLGLKAILADTVTTNKAITANIDESNPKRLNLVIPVKLSGNTNVKSIDLEFGFNFGTAQVAA